MGRGPDAQWLGSTGYDGYPSAIEPALRAHGAFDATTEEQWREAVGAMLHERDDVTLPDEGWPWPWEDSSTTDYAYAWDDGTVWASSFGRAWFDPTFDEPEADLPHSAVFPNMAARQRVKLGGKASGLMVFGPGGETA